MSEVFANYEEEYNKLSSQINKKINNIFNQTNGFLSYFIIYWKEIIRKKGSCNIRSSRGVE